VRSFFLWLSRLQSLRRWMEGSSAARSLTKRFVAGNTLADEVAVSRELNAAGIFVALDHLGENVSTLEEATGSRDHYLQAFRAIENEKLLGSASIKLTQFGLDFSREVCLSNVTPLCEEARRLGTRVEIDMEDSSYTQRTLEIVEELHARYGCVRAVIQAYLHRTDADIDRLNLLAIPVRLCKGAYREPSSVAIQEKSAVDANYVKQMYKLLDHGAYPAIASHDEVIVREALRYVKERGYAPGRFEFQMLYGIRRDLQKEVVAAGYRLRLYVPYGEAWYPYFMRRLAERPANVWFLLRNMLRA
jgi:proline dehydrogenase